MGWPPETIGKAYRGEEEPAEEKCLLFEGAGRFIHRKCGKVVWISCGEMRSKGKRGKDIFG
jgi:hypothetical protein